MNRLEENKIANKLEIDVKNSGAEQKIMLAIAERIKKKIFKNCPGDYLDIFIPERKYYNCTDIYIRLKPEFMVHGQYVSDFGEIHFRYTHEVYSTNFTVSLFSIYGNKYNTSKYLHVRATFKDICKYEEVKRFFKKRTVLNVDTDIIINRWFEEHEKEIDKFLDHVNSILIYRYGVDLCE